MGKACPGGVLGSNCWKFGALGTFSFSWLQGRNERTLLLQSTVISEGSNIDSADAGLKFLCCENQSCGVLLEQVIGLLR
jgi:hypothetical protein